MVASGGLWWPLVASGGLWWPVVASGSHWWPLVALGGPWGPLGALETLQGGKCFFFGQMTNFGQKVKWLKCTKCENNVVFTKTTTKRQQQWS